MKWFSENFSLIFKNTFTGNSSECTYVHHLDVLKSARGSIENILTHITHASTIHRLETRSTLPSVQIIIKCWPAIVKPAKRFLIFNLSRSPIEGSNNNANNFPLRLRYFISILLLHCKSIFWLSLRSVQADRPEGMRWIYQLDLISNTTARTGIGLLVSYIDFFVIFWKERVELRADSSHRLIHVNI